MERRPGKIGAAVIGKPFELAELDAIVKQWVVEGVEMQPRVAAMVRRVVHELGRAYKLTPRELEVLALVAEGKGMRSTLAAVLGVTEATVKTIAARLRAKMKVSSLDEAGRQVLWLALAHGEAAGSGSGGPFQ
jgi:DNA-binding NarL/FixJ family response regulator